MILSWVNSTIQNSQVVNFTTSWKSSALFDLVEALLPKSNSKYQALKISEI